MIKLIFKIMIPLSILYLCYKFIDDKIIKLMEANDRKMMKQIPVNDSDNTIDEIRDFFDNDGNQYMVSIHPNDMECDLCVNEFNDEKNFYIETLRQNDVVTHAIFRKE